jgi:hypothetical protein
MAKEFFALENIMQVHDHTCVLFYSLENYADYSRFLHKLSIQDMLSWFSPHSGQHRFKKSLLNLTAVTCYTSATESTAGKLFRHVIQAQLFSSCELQDTKCDVIIYQQLSKCPTSEKSFDIAYFCFRAAEIIK